MATFTQTQTRPQTPAQARDGHGRAVTVTMWTIQILLGVFLVVASALPKFFGEANAVETFDEIGWGQWFRYVTGTVELAGGIGLFVPRLAGAAATALIGLMAGAALTQILVLEPAWALLPVAFGVALGWIARRRRHETAALLRTLRG